MRFAVLTTLVFAALAAATGGNTCDGGQTYCCNSNPAVLGNPVTGFLQVPLGVILELQCSPITGIDLGGTCDKTTVCCQNVASNGLVNVQCIGVTL